MTHGERLSIPWYIPHPSTIYGLVDTISTKLVGKYRLYVYICLFFQNQKVFWLFSDPVSFISIFLICTQKYEYKRLNPFDLNPIDCPYWTYYMIFRHISTYYMIFWHIIWYSDTFLHTIWYSDILYNILTHSDKLFDILTYYMRFWHILTYYMIFWHIIWYSYTFRQTIWYSDIIIWYSDIL